MRIRQLELTGFKSFPQRTVLEFPDGVTGIVGPNGCGKSNIVDAIRWVLGEQSPKHLRGDSMEAVIFNGNERSAPLGMAEVSLTFENEGTHPAPNDLDVDVSTLPAFVRDLSEIAITRRYYRSGESEYFINKTSCRLKDITELFLGTGVGAKAYGIIEQGRIDQLVNAKPEERRLFIEEAAGTTLYRSRKLAAERKMERTRENLARVNDILAEIGRHVHYLERQAKKAQEFRRLQEQIRELELALASDQWRQLEAEQERLNAQVRELGEAEDALRQAVAVCAAALEQAGAAVAAAEQRLAQLRERFAVVESAGESARERLRLLAHERDERGRRRERLTAELAGVATARQELGVAIETAEREREEWGRARVADEGELARCESELSEARAAANATQNDLEAAKSALVDHITREVEARNAVAALERRREDLARQLGRRRAEAEALAERLRELAGERAARAAELEKLRARLQAASGEKEAQARRLHALMEARRHRERELNELEAAAVHARSRLESLEQIQSNYEGYQRGVRAIMKAERPAEGVVGVVGEVISAPEEYERAVAAVLGERLQYVIVSSEDAAAGAVDLLRREAGGRGSFIPLEPRQVKLNGSVSMNGNTRLLLDVVDVQPSFRAVAEALLGEVVLVPDLDAALALWRQNGVHVTLVTPQGDVIHPSGVITGGSDRPIEEEILVRRREIEALRMSLAGTEARLEVTRAQLTQVRGQTFDAETSLKSLDDGVHALTVEIVGAEKDLERIELEQPQDASRLEVLRYEMDALRDEEHSVATELEAERQRSADLAAQHVQIESEVSQRRAAVAGALERADAVTTAVTALTVRLTERREREHAAAASVDALRQRLTEATGRWERLGEELCSTEREHSELEEALRELQAEEVERRREHEHLQESLAAAGADVEELTHAHRVEEQRGREVQGRLEVTRARRGEVELARAETRLRVEHLTQTMRDKYDVDLALAPVETTADADPVESAARLESLKQRLSRLGDVHVGAIDELREFDERGAALRAQRDDLERALTHLERTIQKLNRASRTRFAETFARANEIFQEVFPRLFRGGEGRLVLTDETDLLETGVDIVVRPPGKRLDSVALLSGGERALVAVSLIFSLFLINPTPFCVLDEVDAPLDDANVGRFNQLVREMSARSQFLLITHNKRTMESADVLYGVTMQEPGISKVISVAMER
jgi:chromosome segregation protein